MTKPRSLPMLHTTQCVTQKPGQDTKRMFYCRYLTC